jgi:hypothetical protein
MRKGANILAFGEQLDEVIDRAESKLPIGVEIHKVSDQPKIVDEAVGHFTRALAEAVIIVMAVSVLAVGLRAGLVVALAVPLTLGITFVVLEYTGFTLQRISLGALIIALGLLVDDAMIAVETMIYRLEKGDGRHQAASYAWRTIAFPMLSGTLITVAGFIPKVGAAINTVPINVLGGGVIIMFGMVAAAGLSMLSEVKWKRRNMVIFATALSLGLPNQPAGNRGASPRLTLTLAYNIGRIASYSIAGALFGSIGALAVHSSGLRSAQTALLVLAWVAVRVKRMTSSCMATCGSASLVSTRSGSTMVTGSAEAVWLPASQVQVAWLAKVWSRTLFALSSTTAR